MISQLNSMIRMFCDGHISAEEIIPFVVKLISKNKDYAAYKDLPSNLQRSIDAHLERFVQNKCWLVVSSSGEEDLSEHAKVLLALKNGREPDQALSNISNAAKSKPTLEELLRQRHAIDQEIAKIRAAELSDAITKIRELIATYGLTSDDILGNRKKTTGPPHTSNDVRLKIYRHAQSGKTWSGRGRPPKWLKDELANGHVIDDFSVPDNG